MNRETTAAGRTLNPQIRDEPRSISARGTSRAKIAVPGIATHSRYHRLAKGALSSHSSKRPARTEVSVSHDHLLTPMENTNTPIVTDSARSPAAGVGIPPEDMFSRPLIHTTVAESVEIIEILWWG